MHWLYPAIMLVQKGKAKKETRVNKDTRPAAPFHALSLTLNNGKEFSFENLKGKKVMIVNTASNCGFTGQYEELQRLYQHRKEDLEIIAVPANDFAAQESGSDADINQFCQVNFGVRFPLAKKAVVVKSEGQHPVFRWLSDPSQNGWNNQPPTWNFSKYLINEEGVLTHYFPPAVSPVSEEVLQAIG